MTAGNDLGFTTAVPAKTIVHTGARAKAIKLGNLTITFKLTAASKLYWAGRPAIRIVQALHWLRDTMTGGDNDLWHRRLTRLLNDPVCRSLREKHVEARWNCRRLYAALRSSSLGLHR